MSAWPDSIHLEMQLAGTGGAWTDVTRDVSNAERIIVSYGIPASGPTDRVADSGSMRFSMKNDQSNSAGILGYYSPGGPNCRTGFQTGITVRLRIVYDGISIQKFYGRIPAGGISVQGGINEARRVSVEVLDWMEQASIHDLYLPTITTNKRIDEIVPLIVANMPIAPTATDYNTGDDTYGTVFDTVRQNTKAATEFQKAAISELGYVYVKPSDTLVVEGRSTRGGRSLSVIPVTKADSGFMLKEDGDYLLLETGGKIVLDQVTNISFDDVQSAMETTHGEELANIVEATAYPRKIDAAPVILFSLSSPLKINAGETKTGYKVTYRDAVTGAKTVSGFNMITPVVTTDYLMNSLEDGTGTNLSADLTVSVTYGTDGAVYELTNGSATNGFITKLNARGYGIYLYDPVTYTATDTASLTTFGTNKLSLDLKYQDDPADAEAFTNIMLGAYKTPITVIDSVSFYANKAGELMGAFLYCDIGSKIHLCETVSGVEGDYFINGIEFEIFENNQIYFTWIVKDSSKDVFTFWEIGTSGKSEIGVTTMLGF